MITRILLLAIILASCTQEKNTREIIHFNQDWQFINQDIDSSALNSDSIAWKSLDLPHDWAIAGDFNMYIDTQAIIVKEDGELRPSLQTGRSGGLPFIGVGWYKKHFQVSESDLNKKHFIEFDGAMSHAMVYVNSQFVGEWPYGYASFSFDISEFLKAGDNLIAVRLQNFEQQSRWYPGAGIYRNVRMVKTNPLFIPQWGTYITTPTVTDDRAEVNIQTKLMNSSDETMDAVLITQIFKDGKKVADVSQKISVAKKSEGKIEQVIVIDNPMLWDVAHPYLYNAKSIVKVNGKIVDEFVSRFGIRTFDFDAEKGFFLNGKSMKIKGVCLHHDLGPLGAAINKSALRRQLEMLKEMGCNAIRISHNPTSPEQLDLCDEMGFLVMAEAFDEWEEGKLENGYSKLFNDWAEKDLIAMIHRDRNHPSVIMWSIGNEVREQNSPRGAEIAKMLTGICHREDPTRTTTAGFNFSDDAIQNGLADEIDILGLNYKPGKYKEYREKYPQYKLIGSETSSTTSSRGVYFLPFKIWKPIKRADLQQCSYDVTGPGWATYPDQEFMAQDENPSVAGEFVWTGFDYLGEPTPYKEEWPSRSSYFGIIDLCGIPKDRYYLYKSQWSQEPVLHLLPHWNWEGKEGDTLPVFCYTNYDSVELFVNEMSYGFKKNTEENFFTRYRLMWMDVIYQPGILKAVAYKDGKAIAEKVLKTASAPAAIRLVPYKNEVNASEGDLAFITVEIVDKEGNLCPLADNLVSFHVEGGTIEAVGNGDPTSLERFKDNKRKAFNGKCMLIVRPNNVSATIKVTASSEGMLEEVLEIKTL